MIPERDKARNTGYFKKKLSSKSSEKLRDRMHQEHERLWNLKILLLKKKISKKTRR